MSVAEWDDLARLAQAATPGPWERDGGAVLGPREADDLAQGPIRLAGMAGPFRHGQVQANAEFIAAANPSTILRLITERDALAARLAAVEALAERWCHCGDPGDPRRQAASALRAALAAPIDTTKEN